MSLIMLTVAAVLLLGGGAATAQTPSFPAGTEIVTVDTVVHDRAGNPVPGLTAADFTLLDDGIRQEIVAFEAVSRPGGDAAATGAPAGPLRTSSNVDAAARAARTFVIVFDERHMDVAEASRGREAVKRFLETGADGDRVTLAGTGSGAAWTARLPEGRAALLGVLDNLHGRRHGDLVRDAISDYEAMRIDRDTDWVVIDRVTRRLAATGAIPRAARLPGDPPETGDDRESERGRTRARAAEVYAKATVDNEATLALLERALSGLSAGRGRKSLILVSGGFIHDPHLPAFRRVVTAALRASVALYFVDARGVIAAPAALQADTSAPVNFNDLGATLTGIRDASEGSESLAADTGGFTVRDNDVAGGLDRIARESGRYYLLGFRPAAGRADGRFRKIEVRVARADAVVRARRGYYAPDANAPPAPPAARDADIQRALDSPFELADVPLRATTHVFGPAGSDKAAVVVTAEADIRGLAFQLGGGAARDALEMMLVVTNRDTAESFRFDQQFEMAFKPETRARYEASWFPVRRRLELVPGAYQAKLIMRDRNARRVGSLTHDFDVPAPGGLRISTPILSDRRGEDPGAALEPTARRTFAPAGLLHCRFEVYGAGRDPRTGQPDVLAGFSIRRADGRRLAAGAETPMKAGPDGSLVRSFGAQLDGAPPGRYEMIVLVTDQAGGAAAEIREPFVIAAAGATPD